MITLLSRLALAAILSLTVLAGAEAQTPPDAERAAAAKDLMAAMKTDDQLNKTLDSVKGLLTQQLKSQPGGDKAMEVINKVFAPDSEALKAYLVDAEASMIAFYSERFTAAEMKDIAAFQRSPSGEKLRAAMPDLIQALGPPLGKFQTALKKTLVEELNPKPAAKPEETKPDAKPDAKEAPKP